MEEGNISKVVNLNPFKLACNDCGLYQLCLPVGIGSEELEQLDRIIKRRRPLKRGEHLFQLNNSFKAIYAVHSGSIKTYVPTEDGNEQITGFHLPGELLGLDAISPRRHPCAAKALETTTLCEIPYDKLGELAKQLPTLQHHLLSIMSQEILHDHSLLTLLGKRSAEERLAALLLSLSERYRQRGFSPTELALSMSRNDIANYLGMVVETVSRLFTRFQEEGVLQVERKQVRILSLDLLAAMASGSQPLRSSAEATSRDDRARR
ncbi:MAG TPA: fumarate/nitrate reduction transcriptional regulator Fnr [Gammaproteobacteria bacterium]